MVGAVGEEVGWGGAVEDDEEEGSEGGDAGEDDDDVHFDAIRLVSLSFLGCLACKLVEFWALTIQFEV